MNNIWSNSSVFQEKYTYSLFSSEGWGNLINFIMLNIILTLIYSIELDLGPSYLGV